MIVGKRAGCAASRVGIPLRTAPRPVLDGHARREGHCFFAEPADLEHVRWRLSEYQVALFIQLRAVVVDDVGERCCGAVGNSAGSGPRRTTREIARMDKQGTRRPRRPVRWDRRTPAPESQSAAQATTG